MYNVHFGSVSSEERQRQAKFLIALLHETPSQGGEWTGPSSKNLDRDWSAGLTRPPMPEEAMVMGDFNMQPESPEYETISTSKTEQSEHLLRDIWAEKNPGCSVLTWHPNSSRPVWTELELL